MKKCNFCNNEGSIKVSIGDDVIYVCSDHTVYLQLCESAMKHDQPIERVIEFFQTTGFLFEELIESQEDMMNSDEGMAFDQNNLRFIKKLETLIFSQQEYLPELFIAWLGVEES